MGQKIYNICDSKTYINNMTVTGLTARLENVQHNQYMDNFFHIQHYLTIHILKKKWCGTIRAKINDTLKNFGQKMKLQQGDIKTNVRGHLTATVWKDKDKKKVHILSNMQYPSQRVNL
jgi:hypothetical protein